MDLLRTGINNQDSSEVDKWVETQSGLSHINNETSNFKKPTKMK